MSEQPRKRTIVDRYQGECQWCGRPMYMPVGGWSWRRSGNGRKWCSRAHRDAAYNEARRERRALERATAGRARR